MLHLFRQGGKLLQAHLDNREVVLVGSFPSIGQSNESSHCWDFLAGENTFFSRMLLRRGTELHNTVHQSDTDVCFLWK